MDVVKIVIVVHKRRICGVDGNQRDSIALPVEAFESGFFPDAYGGDLAVFNFGLAAYANYVAVQIARRSIFRLHLYYTNFFGESIFVRRGKVGIVWVRRKFKNKNEIYFFPLSSEMFTFCAFSQISSMCL